MRKLNYNGNTNNKLEDYLSLGYLDMAKIKKEKRISKLKEKRNTPATYEENVRKVQEEKEYWNSNQILELERILEGRREQYWLIEDRLRALNDYINSENLSDIRILNQNYIKTITRLRESLVDLATKESLEKAITKGRLERDYVENTLSKTEIYLDSLKKIPKPSKKTVKKTEISSTEIQKPAYEKSPWREENQYALPLSYRIGIKYDQFKDKLRSIENKYSIGLMSEVENLVENVKSYLFNRKGKSVKKVRESEVQPANIINLQKEKETRKGKLIINGARIAAAALLGWWGMHVVYGKAANSPEKEDKAHSYIIQEMAKKDQEEVMDITPINNSGMNKGHYPASILFGFDSFK